jgi:DUF4097 and DUF4098 domain-containing protein YvlB
VSGISGAVNISNRFGAVDFRDVGMVTASNASGSITGSNVNGSASVSTTFGAVSLRKVARDARVINASGPVKVSDVDGPVYLKTSFGAIEAERVRGELTAENASGSISAAGVGGAARVSTSFGPVVLKEVDGRVDVTNRSGSVEAWPAGRPGTCHDVMLTTSFSPMVVHLPDTGYAVAARTTFGRIQADVPIAASSTLGANAVSGTIGRGGCALRLTNASGDIRIARAVASR